LLIVNPALRITVNCFGWPPIC